MKQIDMIVHARHMFTMEGEGVGYRRDHSVAIDRGKIEAVAPRKEIEREYLAQQVLDEPDQLVLPGFIDAHMHVQECGLRGLAQDVGNWMMHGVGPFEAGVDDNFEAASLKLGIAEAVLNGTTTIGENGQSREELFRFLEQLGVRGNIAIHIRDAVPRVYEPGELYEYSPDYGDRTLNSALEAYERWHGAANGRIRILFGPQGADFVSQERLHRIRALAKERGTYIYMHLAQGSRETQQMEMRYGQRTIPWLLGQGYLDKSFIGIHLTDATDEETQAVARTGAGMVLCSGSIGIIDGIVPPAKVFQDSGGMVGLGSDQAPGNNCHNIFNEMKLTALFNKIKYEDPEVLPCWRALRMATIEGARAVGIGDVVGSLEAGKDADLILVDLRQPSMAPVYTAPMRNLVPNLVYSATGREVTTVIAGGEIVVREGRLLRCGLEEILDQMQREADRVAPAAEEQFWRINGKNAQYMRAGLL